MLAMEALYHLSHSTRPFLLGIFTNYLTKLASNRHPPDL
jgi:hypothetical protein